jgi:CMP-N,N'-diacetyllegionaminic acid synthase
MGKSQRVLAIVPARRGSRRVENKNIRNCCGKPLIAWTIEAAIRAKTITSVLVSTDCERIGEIGRRYGAEVPFYRPEGLARSDTPSEAVIVHTLSKLARLSRFYDIFILLQPTSPLRDEEHIEEALEIFLNERPDSLSSVCEGAKDTQQSYNISRKDFYKCVKSLEGNNLLDKAGCSFALNGAIYIAPTLSRHDGFFQGWGEKRLGYCMRKQASLDIDFEEDLILAKRRMRSKLEMGNRTDWSGQK